MSTNTFGNSGAQRTLADEWLARCGISKTCATCVHAHKTYRSNWICLVDPEHPEQKWATFSCAAWKVGVHEEEA
jgi:hypothetical protein